MKCIALASLALAACAAEPAAPTLDPVAKTDCDDFLCTSNSPLVGAFAVPELATTGAVSPEGFSLAGAYTAAHQAGALSFAGGSPTITVGHTPYTGHRLLNATFVVNTPLPAPNHVVTLKIIEVHDEPYFDGGMAPALYAFRLQYLYVDPVTLATSLRDVCPLETLDVDGMASTLAILSQGERFDRATNSITASGVAALPWFNISCAGDARAKLVRIRHAYGTDDGAHATTLDERKAAFAMFTGKYCPGGSLFTKYGQPLVFEDHAPFTSYDDEGTTFEAIWTATGAYCLDVPRYALRDTIEAECAIPACTDDDRANWRAHGGLLVSAVPPPAP